MTPARLLALGLSDQLASAHSRALAPSGFGCSSIA